MPENSIKRFMSEKEYARRKAAEARRHGTYTINEGVKDITDDFTNKSSEIMSYCIKGVCYVGTAAYIAHIMGLNPYAGGKTKRNKQRKRKKTEKKRKRKRKRTSRRAL